MFILYMCILCICISINVGFPGGTSTKEPPASARDVRDSGSAPGLGRSPGGGHGNPLFLPEKSHG